MSQIDKELGKNNHKLAHAQTHTKNLILIKQQKTLTNNNLNSFSCFFSNFERL